MKRFVAYLLAGGTAAALNWSSRFLFSIWLSYAASIVCAFFVGLVCGFVLMPGWFSMVRASRRCRRPECTWS